MSPITVILLFLLSSLFLSAQPCSPDELQALLTFRSTVNGTQGYLSSWEGSDCCKWDGVECHGTQGRRHVSTLDLRGRILTISNLGWLSNLSALEYLSLADVVVSDKRWGSIIGSLLHLKHLDLSSCSLPTSTIPTALVNLSYLTFLDLSLNSFSNLPTWISSLTYLDLYGNNISSIPNAIGKLSSLTHLDLSENNISGSIPNAIAKVVGLQYLNLWDNALTGQIPSGLGFLINLTHLDLSQNQLSGPIPSSIGNLLLLEDLWLEYNQLQSTIPASLGNLHNLKFLWLSDNQLSGSLPLSFSKLVSLTHLNINHNHLNGSIPSALTLPSSLWTLDLSNNMMNGTVTEVFFQKSSKLEYLHLFHSGLSINISSTWIPSFQLRVLYLRKCQIGGPIPSWISTQFRLGELDLSATQLVGDLPSWLWDIRTIDLSENHLEGSFSPTSGSVSHYLDLSMNQLSGRLPTDIHMLLPAVTALILADNQFQEQIPASIANLTFLLFLDMSNNCLTGNVPAAFSNLEALNLENNYLKGEIPKELGFLSFLRALRIGKNSLHGVLPSFLTNLSSLEVLDVGENKLTGNIPRWIANFSYLHVLVIRSNNFRGVLPPDIGRMPMLQVLDLSSNFFSGTIPPSYLRFPAMQNSSAHGQYLSYQGIKYSIDLIIKGMEMHYEYVLSNLICFDLSNNRLTGRLPPEIENLKGLMYLNLSMNCLSGPLPESLGNLVQLESVDLSFNEFSGKIPWQVGKLTYLALLNLSYNNLCGRIPQEGPQMLTFGESSYLGNPNLWGCPLKRNCSRPNARASPPLLVGVKEKRDEDLEFIWYWMCFGLAVGVGFSGVVMLLVLKIRWRIKYFEVMDKVIKAMDKVIWMLLKPQPKPVWR